MLAFGCIFLKSQISWTIFVNQSLVVWLQGFDVRNVRFVVRLCIQVVVPGKSKEFVGEV